MKLQRTKKRREPRPSVIPVATPMTRHPRFPSGPKGIYIEVQVSTSTSSNTSGPARAELRDQGKEVDMENHCHCSEKAQNKSDGGPNLTVRTAARIFAYVASHAIWDLFS